MNWNDGINDIIREALQVLKQRQEAAQQQADIERLKKENDSLQTEIHRLQEEVELWKSRCEDNT